jgi:hypothetical protein
VGSRRWAVPATANWLRPTPNGQLQMANRQLTPADCPLLTAHFLLPTKYRQSQIANRQLHTFERRPLSASHHGFIEIQECLREDGCGGVFGGRDVLGGGFFADGQELFRGCGICGEDGKLLFI